MRLYKYQKSEFVEGFVNGNILFRPLSYFRALEDGQTRGDDMEGHHVHQPENGLIMNLTDRPLTLKATALNAKVKFDDVFIFCASTELSPKLADEFNVDACVEILDVRKFSRLVARAVNRQENGIRYVPYGLVDYVLTSMKLAQCMRCQTKLQCVNLLSLSDKRNGELCLVATAHSMLTMSI